jgi:hypothetical protein
VRWLFAQARTRKQHKQPTPSASTADSNNSSWECSLDLGFAAKEEEYQDWLSGRTPVAAEEHNSFEWSP